MNRERLLALRTKLMVIRDGIKENELDQFDLKWFTPERLRHIRKLLEEFEELKKLGFNNEVIQYLENTLWHLMLGYGFKEKKDRLESLKGALFHIPVFGSKKKARTKVIDDYRVLKTRDPGMINTYLAKLIIQINQYINDPESLEQDSAALGDKDEREKRHDYLEKFGFPVITLHWQAEFIVLKWKALVPYVGKTENENFGFVRSLAAFGHNLPQKVFRRKFEAICRLIYTNIQHINKNQLPEGFHFGFYKARIIQPIKKRKLTFDDDPGY